jgi:hypothetical protein
MHKEFNGENIELWTNYFNDQASQVGYGLDGFHGSRYQRGAGLGSFFRSLFRMAVPVFKSAASHVGKQALSTGASIASDLVNGRSLGEAAEEHGRTGVTNLLNEASRALQQKGRGLGSRPKGISTSIKDIFPEKVKKRKK